MEEFQVFWTEGAVRDLEELVAHIAKVILATQAYLQSVEKRNQLLTP